MVVITTAGGNDEQSTREGNDGRVERLNRMEYLVVFAIILIVIAYILNDCDNK
jgi:hypothetical protein